MRFREHRGALQDSLDTEVELSPTLQALQTRLQQLWPTLDLSTGQSGLIAEPYVDARNGYTHILVCGIGVLGFIDFNPGLPERQANG